MMLNSLKAPAVAPPQSPTRDTHVMLAILADLIVGNDNRIRALDHAGSSAAAPPVQVPGDLLRRPIRLSARVDRDPPTFGQYGHCGARSRCVGCEHVCVDEAKLVALAQPCGGSRTAGDDELIVVEFVAEEGRDLGEGWTCAEVYVPNRPYLSGPYALSMLPPAGLLQLVSLDGCTVLTPMGAGLIVDVRQTPMQGAWQGRVAASWDLARRAAALTAVTVPSEQPADAHRSRPAPQVAMQEVAA